jgi:hypothetical protein
MRGFMRLVIIISLSISMFLVGYVYTLFSAHIMLARIDKKIKIPRRKCGEIKIKDLKKFAVKFDGYESEITNAIFFLKLNNYVIYSLSGLLIILITIK